MRNAPLLPDGRPAQLFPVDRRRVRLRLYEPAHFHFLHGAVLHGLLCRSLNRSLPAGLAPLALESGQVRFGVGEAYDFVVSAWGESRALLAGLEPRLRSLGQRALRKVGEPLEAAFDVEEVVPLPTPSLARCLERAERLADEGFVRMIFHAPLCLWGPRPGVTSAPFFPLATFLEQVWSRYCEAFGAEPGDEGAYLPPETQARVEHLQWLDLPLQGRFDPAAKRRTGERISGFCGSLQIKALPLPWLRLLVLMENAQIGSAAQYGFGAFALDQVPSWRRPASTFAERLHAAPSPRSANELLAPSALALLDDGAAFHHRGLSCFSAEGGRRRARQMGLNGPVGGAASRFVAGLCEHEVMGRLRALWPAEPLIEHFPAWLRRPEQRQELGRLLAKVFASELADALIGEGRWLVRVGSELRVLGREAARVA